MKKITRRKARKLYETNRPFVMVPGDYRPDSWAACLIDSRGHEDQDFDSLCNEFFYYNNEISKCISFWCERQ